MRTICCIISFNLHNNSGKKNEHLLLGTTKEETDPEWLHNLGKVPEGRKHLEMLHMVKEGKSIFFFKAEWWVCEEFILLFITP